MMTCPYAVRNNLPFLMCKLLMKEGVDYAKADSGGKAFCAYQHFCPRTKRNENTENARKCYEYHSQKS